MEETSFDCSHSLTRLPLLESVSIFFLLKKYWDSGFTYTEYVFLYSSMTLLWKRVVLANARDLVLVHSLANQVPHLALLLHIAEAPLNVGEVGDVYVVDSSLSHFAC